MPVHLGAGLVMVAERRPYCPNKKQAFDGIACIQYIEEYSAKGLSRTIQYL